MALSRGFQLEAHCFASQAKFDGGRLCRSLVFIMKTLFILVSLGICRGHRLVAFARALRMLLIRLRLDRCGRGVQCSPGVGVRLRKNRITPEHLPACQRH